MIDLRIFWVKSTRELAAFHLAKICTRNSTVYSPFLISTALLLISIRKFHIGSVCASSTAHNSFAE